MIVRWSVKRVMQVLFQLLKLLWGNRGWQRAGLIIEMIQYSPKICLKELLRIECDLLLDESRGGGLILSPLGERQCVFILEQSPKFLRRTALDRWKTLLDQWKTRALGDPPFAVEARYVSPFPTAADPLKAGKPARG